MKRLSLIFAFAFCCGPVGFAQSLLRAQSYSVYDSTGTFSLVDSTWYYYSGSRGSYVAPLVSGKSIDFLNLDRNIAFDSSFSQSQPTGMPHTRIIHGYDPGNNIIAELTASLVPVAAYYRYDNVMMVNHTNNAAGDRTYSSVWNWDASGPAWWEGIRTYYSVNALHGIDTVINEFNDYTTGGLWTYAKRLIFSYDAAGNRTSVLIQNPDAWMGGWIDVGRNTMTYDAGGNVLSRFVEIRVADTFGLLSWANLEKWVNTFNASGKVVSSAFYWYGGAPTSVLTQLDSFTYDAHNNLAMVVSQTANTATALTNARRYSYVYNSYDQLTALHTRTWDTGSLTWGVSAAIDNPDYIRRYYYSDSANAPFDPNPTLGVAAVGSPGDGQINVFPSPANGTLNVDITWHTAQPFAIAIYDVQGRLWAQWQAAACTHYADVLPVANMPAGMYMMKVTGTTGTQVQQFVVAH